MTVYGLFSLGRGWLDEIRSGASGVQPGIVANITVDGSRPAWGMRAWGRAALH